MLKELTISKAGRNMYSLSWYSRVTLGFMSTAGFAKHRIGSNQLRMRRLKKVLRRRWQLGFALREAEVYTWKNLKEYVSGRGRCMNQRRVWKYKLNSVMCRVQRGWRGACWGRR